MLRHHRPGRAIPDPNPRRLEPLEAASEKPTPRRPTLYPFPIDLFDTHHKTIEEEKVDEVDVERGLETGKFTEMFHDDVHESRPTVLPSDSTMRVQVLQEREEHHEQQQREQEKEQHQHQHASTHDSKRMQEDNEEVLVDEEDLAKIRIHQDAMKAATAAPNVEES